MCDEAVGDQALGVGLSQVIDIGDAGSFNRDDGVFVKLTIGGATLVADKGHQRRLFFVLEEADFLGKAIPIGFADDQLILRLMRVQASTAFTVRH